MRLYVQEKNSLLKFNLPAKVDGSMLFSFKSSINGLDNSINVDAVNGEWVLKSNGNVNIIGNNNTVLPELILSDYLCVPISITGIPDFLCVFCLPSIEDHQTNYSIVNMEAIKIGRSSDNNIVYTQNLMAPCHAIIKLEKNNWYIFPATTNIKDYIYVNNRRILGGTPIFAGDIIFMNGLRIIWMKKSFIIPMADNLYRVNGIQVFGSTDFDDNTKYTPASEVDKNLVLYNDNDYYSHTPRIRSVLEPHTVVIDSPPTRAGGDSDLPFLLSFGSSFSMLGMMSINAFNLYDGLSSGKKDVVQMLPQIVMITTMLIGSILVPLLTKRWNKKLQKEKEKKRQQKYGDYLLEKEKEISALTKMQEQIISEINFDMNTCIQIIKNKSNNLWNRVIRDDDFLEIRLGVGDRPSCIELRAPKDTFTLDDDNLYKAVVQLGKKYEKLKNVPISVSLKDQIVIALILETKMKNEFINGVLLQLLSLHSPIDLKIVVFTDYANSYRWNYLKYTNHNWNDTHDVRFFSNNQDDAKALSQYLDTEYLDRKDRKTQREKEFSDANKDRVEEYVLYDSYYLVITDNFKSVRNFKFFKDMLESQFNYGFSLLVIEKNMKNIPNECKKFLVINDSESGVLSDKVNDADTLKFKAEFAQGLNMRQIGKMVGNIPVQGRDAESQLPAHLSFLQMYNVGKIEQLNVRNRWLTSDPMTTLQVPIGVHASGEIFNLDLHEKHDGPHGLIAGSTGSGKSEFIITYILSMALNYDPREVQFVLIDYKGGGLAGAFENRELGISIPHLAGTITNLDTAEMNRTLVSIESELKRRQVRFNIVKEQTGESTMDIYKYQRLYRDGLIDEPISHLFIISDEFAELKAQRPEFMAQLVSTARIGRSLGVHLILATQKPSGVVNDQIWSNSKFKVCLKVATRADSMEMLKRPEAASLKEAGRFYLQVGYDEYFDIGQSGWSGEKYVPTDRIIKKVDDSIVFVDNFGNVIKRSVEKVKKDETIKDIGDQLTNIVKYLYEIARKDGFEPKKLWLPSLNKIIILSQLLEKYGYKHNSNEFSVKAIIGEYDAPANQKQGLLKIDFLNDGNLLIYGASGSGKENLVSTIVYYLTNNYSPSDLNIYIGDFGSESLKLLERLPHVGDVFVTEEAEKLECFVKMLEKELERRKKCYAEYGGNYIEYVKLSGKKDQFIVSILNNFEVFQEVYSRNAEVFNTLFRDSSKYGMIFIVTTTVQNAIRARVAQNFVNKICMKMPNDTDYRDLLGSPRGMIPLDNFGRGIALVNESETYEFQTADMCDRDSKTQFIREYSAELSKKYTDIKVKKIPVLPEIVYVDDVLFELKDLTCVPIGIEKNSLEVYVYDFLYKKINLIAAKSIKNHIYFVYALIAQMLKLDNVKIHVVDALSIYRGNYENIDLYSNNLDDGFLTAYKNVKADSSLKEQHVYFILGVSEFKKKVVKYNKHFELLFSQVSKCKNNTFLYFDDSDNYKIIQIEKWFRDNIDNTFGIWLGEDVSTQVSLGVMSLTVQEKQLLFNCIGYPIYQGNHMIIKYVVDGVDRKDE